MTAPASDASASFQEFFRTEAACGAVLVACAATALVIANSGWAGAYERLWHFPVTLGMGSHALSLTLQQWINDGLMALFFLLIGLEMKREALGGELASPRQAALPIAGAIGGMGVPALLFAAASGDSAARGWAIPMATDIAFALGILGLVAPNAPPGLKIFLAALAIIDDLGAVLVIAIVYTQTIAWGALAMAGGIIAVLAALNWRGVRQLSPYLIVGLALWYFVHESGLHATIAGVLLALAIPMRAPLLRLEHALHGVSVFVVMPLFALSNAGVVLGGSSSARVTLAVVLGLVVGKPLGITVAAVMAVRWRLATLPAGVTWLALHGCAWLGGIGFTMSLFITMLAFNGSPLIEAAKLGVLAGSAVTGVVGAILVRASLRVPSVTA
jgi:NhaA family Na+:H+ antiporter